MIIINTTFVLDPSIADAALEWIRNTYAASAPQKAGMLARVLANEGEGAYALHLSFPDMGQARDWDERLGAPLRHSIVKLWGEKALSFCTYLETVE
ncbi:MAG: DUF4286 family protein [Clostridium sp.]|nr:DUF4286 family protein [Clostridium sp.]